MTNRPQQGKAIDRSTPQGDAGARDQQELYGRRAPDDLDEGPGVGRGDASLDAADAQPARGQDASGQPSTARSGANTQ